MADRYTQKRRGQKRSASYTAIAVILVILALIISLSVFFRVKSVIIEGNSYYTDEQIKKVAEVEEGDNLILMNESGIAGKICTEYLCIDSVKISRSFPGSVIIEVVESTPAAYVKCDGDYWIINESCRALEQAEKGDLQGLVEIVGISPETPEVGEIVTDQEGSGLLTEYLSQILRQAVKQEILGKISYIDVANVTNIQLEYDGRYTVKIGRGESAEIKLKNLIAVTEELSPGERGVIDVTDEKETHFTPK